MEKLTLRSGLKAKKPGSLFPDGPVVNLLFANDPNIFFKPDVRRHAGAEVRRNGGDVKRVLFIRSRWIPHLYSRDLPVLRFRDRPNSAPMRRSPGLVHDERKTKDRGDFTGVEPFKKARSKLPSRGPPIIRTQPVKAIAADQISRVRVHPIRRRASYDTAGL